MALVIPVLTKTKNLLIELARVLPNITFHEVQTPDKDPYFKESKILICDFDLLSHHMYDLPNAEWIQGTWAGVDKISQAYQKSKQLNYQLTRFSGDHFGKIMGEYVVANIVNHERNLFEVRKNQEKSLWSADGKIEDYRVIYDLTIGVLGLGHIGNRIGKLLHFLGAKVVGLGRRLTLPQSEEYSHISKYYTQDNLPSLLKECDYVINVLPSTVETNNILDNDVLQNCTEKGSVLINIGRGNIISETSLIKALKNKWISAAILDVFAVEPLPRESPLWEMKEVFITPHVAGHSRAKDIAEQFKTNFQRYQNNQPLPAVVDLEKGY